MKGVLNRSIREVRLPGQREPDGISRPAFLIRGTVILAVGMAVFSCKATLPIIPSHLTAKNEGLEIGIINFSGPLDQYKSGEKSYRPDDHTLGYYRVDVLYRNHTTDYRMIYPLAARLEEYKRMIKTEGGEVAPAPNIPVDVLYCCSSNEIRQKQYENRGKRPYDVIPLQPQRWDMRSLFFYFPRDREPKEILFFVGGEGGESKEIARIPLRQSSK